MEVLGESNTSCRYKPEVKEIRHWAEGIKLHSSLSFIAGGGFFVLYFNFMHINNEMILVTIRGVYQKGKCNWNYFSTFISPKSREDFIFTMNGNVLQFL